MTTFFDKLKLMSVNIRRQVSGVRYRVKGFTLIELLIVVAIISILVSIGAVSFSRVQSQGRDTQRKAALQEVASALEQYYSDFNSYPDQDASFRIDCGGGGFVWGGAGVDFTCGGTIFLSDLPGDPQGTNEYRYQSLHVDGVTDCTNANFDCQRFILSAKLERDDTPCDGTYDFCVNNP